MSFRTWMNQGDGGPAEQVPYGLDPICQCGTRVVREGTSRSGASVWGCPNPQCPSNLADDLA